jgi:hypothetical protein
MVVNDLNLPGFAIAPDKTDTPLVVYAQAIPPPTTSSQCFQAIARRSPQVIKLSSSLNSQELCPRPSLNLHR